VFFGIAELHKKTNKISIKEKTKMKATRKLIPAIAMLLISAVMMSTATFAWFSTNSTVDVTGMTITAKANNTYLVISQTSTMNNETYTTTTVEAKNKSATVYPIMYCTTSDAAKKLEAGKWYTAVGTSISNGAAASTDEDQIPDYTERTTLGSYVIENTFYIRVANNFNPATNLVLSDVTLAGNNSEVVGVVAKTNEGVNTYINETLDNTSGGALAANVNSSGEIVVTVYVYINGEHDLVNTNNATNLESLGVSLEFSVTSAES
jgi:hypothetical protein